jgi:hypothetical protein
MRRRLSLVLVGLLTATVLSGCSPAPSDQVAIRVVNGEPEFVFAPCPGQRVHDVILNEETSEDRRTWHASGGPEFPVTSVRLFHTPAGWITANDSLTALESGMTYVASVYASDGRQSDLRFISLAAIEALTDGQVLGRGETASRATAMSMADFERKAASSCDD